MCVLLNSFPGEEVGVPRGAAVVGVEELRGPQAASASCLRLLAPGPGLGMQLKRSNSSGMESVLLPSELQSHWGRPALTHGAFPTGAGSARAPRPSLPPGTPLLNTQSLLLPCSWSGDLPGGLHHLLGSLGTR